MEDEETPKDVGALSSTEKETTSVIAPVTCDEQQSAESSAKNVTYEDGEAIYTDEATKYKYKWCKESKQWKPLENEHYKWCEETQKWIPKVPLENDFYRWCDRTNQWIPKMVKGTDEDKDGVYGYDEKEKYQTYTDKDGVVFFWDGDKRAWFPRVDDDFLAIYQMNYGFIDNTTPATKVAEDEEKDEKIPETAAASAIQDDESTSRKRKAPALPPKWFDIPAEQNTKVYVSDLPNDITEEEFGELMSKCGLVMKDLKNGKLKLKLYRNSDGQLKGDGLCHYIKVESVELALNVLDGYELRGKSIKVQRAEFQMRGEYNPALKPRLRKHDKEKQKKIQEKLFDWRPEKMRGERSKNERTVIIKNLFEPELFDREVHLILDYQADLREECNKCGTVRKVIIYDRHQEGIAQVIMGDPEEADLVIKMMNGRMYASRKLVAETWDGKTKYKIDESDTARSERLQKWDTFLETGEEKEKEKEKAEEVEVSEGQSTTINVSHDVDDDDDVVNNDDVNS